MGQSTFQRAFGGGELAPALAARADIAKYQTGLRTCRNFVVMKAGGLTNRPGLRFVSACKTNDPLVQLLPYVSEVEGESVLLEQGAGYLRFFLNGAPLTVDLGDVDAWDGVTNYVQGDLVQDGGAVFYAKLANTGVATTDAPTWHPFTGTLYEVPTPFTHLMNWVQSGRVITFTHRLEAPYELYFISLTRWVLLPISTVSTLTAPTGLVLTPGGAGTRSYGYVVTAGMAVTYEESPPSGQVINGGTADPTPAAPNNLTWTPVAGAAEYYIYADPFANGTYGFIGTATGAAVFNDTGIDPDFARTPPVDRVLFAAAGDYPHVAAYYQQRRFFANTVNDPDAVWGSRTGFPSNFGTSSPLQDDDSVTFKIAGNNHNPVRHLVAVKNLILLTGAGEWTIVAGGEPLTPSHLPADQQTYVGANETRPVIIGNACLYVQARGHVLHDLRFDMEVEGLGGRDLGVFATHLFDSHTVTDIDFQQNPDSIVWAVRSDGTLLGLTYLRDQEVWGWHRHDTGAAGHFEHVCVVPETDHDVVYVIVKRTIGGATKRYIEKLENRIIRTGQFALDAFFVDSGLTYSGSPATVISGLSHLEGQTVTVLGDGVAVGTFVVASGAITLPAARSIVHVGLPIAYADAELLDLDVAGSSVRDKKKRVGSVTLLIEGSSRVFWAGSDTAHLTQYKLPPYEPAADQFTGSVEINMSSRFNEHGRVFIRQIDPLPLTILGVLPNVEMGG